MYRLRPLCIINTTVFTRGVTHTVSHSTICTFALRCCVARHVRISTTKTSLFAGSVAHTVTLTTMFSDSFVPLCVSYTDVLTYCMARSVSLITVCTVAPRCGAARAMCNPVLCRPLRLFVACHTRCVFPIDMSSCLSWKLRLLSEATYARCCAIGKDCRCIKSSCVLDIEAAST